MIIQTYQPENFAIQCVRKQTNEKFYETELELRKQLKYPPFCDIIVIGISGRNEEEITVLENWIYSYLVMHLPQNQYKIFNPMPAPIDKIQNRIRHRIIMKGKMTNQANEILNDCLHQVYQKSLKDTRVMIDINPNNMS